MDAVAPVMPEWFKAQMRRLAGLKFAPADGRTHWEALRDMDEVSVGVAVDYAQRSCDAFPSPKELREFAVWQRSKAVAVEDAPDRVEELAAPVMLGTLPTGTVVKATRIWKYYCEACGDLGWTSWWCGDTVENRQPWVGASRCQRHREHGAHEWVGLCACAESNPDVQRRRERDLQGPRRGARDGE